MQCHWEIPHPLAVLPQLHHGRLHQHVTPHSALVLPRPVHKLTKVLPLCAFIFPMEKYDPATLHLQTEDV